MANAVLAAAGEGAGRGSRYMGAVHENNTAEHVPNAEIVHDRFHVAKHLNEAVDRVRRQEKKELPAQGDEHLIGSNQLWLYHPDDLDSNRKAELAELRSESLRTGRAWAIKESFHRF